jgi:hypothetical protein
MEYLKGSQGIRNPHLLLNQSKKIEYIVHAGIIAALKITINGTKKLYFLFFPK